MPRLIHATPKYRRHRTSGQAVVVIQGKYHYLGSFGSESSKAAYDRLIAEWLAKGRAPRTQPKESEITISELIVAYWRFVVTHYVKNGIPSAEQDCIKAAIRPVRRLYGRIPATKFGPVSLKAVVRWHHRSPWNFSKRVTKHTPRLGRHRPGSKT